MIQKQIAKEMRANRSETFDLFIDFDSAAPYKGIHSESLKVNINKYGKSTEVGLTKADINNTSAANKVELKIFKKNTRKAERLRKLGIGMEAKNSANQINENEYGLIAEAEISLSHLKNF